MPIFCTFCVCTCASGRFRAVGKTALTCVLTFKTHEQVPGFHARNHWW